MAITVQNQENLGSVRNKINEIAADVETLSERSTALAGSSAAPAYSFASDLDTGMYRSGENRLSFSTGGFESLQLNGGTRSFPITTGDGAIILGNGRTADSAVHYNLCSDLTYPTGTRFGRNAGENGSSYISHRGTGSLYFQTVEAAPIAFYTTNVEAARFTPTGEFCVGAVQSVLGEKVTINQTGAEPVLALRCTGSDFQNLINFYNAGGGLKGSVSATATTVAYNTSSDHRLKKDVMPMVGALAKVAQLNPVTYKWRADDSDGQGFIAHELQTVIPDCVSGEVDAVYPNGEPNYQGVDTSFLVATLTKAIQEQQAIITDLVARITALEATT